MIVLLVSLSVTNLQILTATEPDSPAAEPGMNRALTWIMIIGGICICIGLWILFKIPNSINSPFKSLVKGILEIANHNYDAKLDLRGDKELEEVEAVPEEEPKPKKYKDEYIIPGSGFRMLVGDIHHLIVLYYSLARRLSEAETEKDFLLFEYVLK